MTTGHLNRYYLVPASKSSIAGHKKRYINSGIRYGYLGLWQCDEQYECSKENGSHLTLGSSEEERLEMNAAGGLEQEPPWGRRGEFLSLLQKEMLKGTKARTKQVGGGLALGQRRTDNSVLSGYPQEAVENHRSHSGKVLETMRSPRQTSQGDTICYWSRHLTGRASNGKG